MIDGAMHSLACEPHSSERRKLDLHEELDYALKKAVKNKIAKPKLGDDKMKGFGPSPSQISLGLKKWRWCIFMAWVKSSMVIPDANLMR